MSVFPAVKGPGEFFRHGKSMFKLLKTRGLLFYGLTAFPRGTDDAPTFCRSSRRTGIRWWWRITRWPGVLTLHVSAGRQAVRGWSPGALEV